MATTDTLHVTPLFLLNIKEPRNFSRLLEYNQAVFESLTETHLNVDVSDAGIHIPGYVVFRTDKRQKARDKIAIRFREDVKPVVLLSRSSPVCNTLVVHVNSNPDIRTHEDSFEKCLLQEIKKYKRAYMTPCTYFFYGIYTFLGSNGQRGIISRVYHCMIWGKQNLWPHKHILYGENCAPPDKEK